MLIDLHAHSSGISVCCRIPFETALHRTLEHGMDGIFLTNHYQKSYIGPDGTDAFVSRYLAEYHAAHRCGQQLGCRVFFGIEVTMELYPNVHMLLYGVEPEFLTRYPDLFDCTQQQLYETVHGSGGVLIQAHPFRNGTTVLEPRWLDGVEINCHPLYGNAYAPELLQIGRQEGLPVTCGGDYHADTYRPQCGMYLPEQVCTPADFRDHLLHAPEHRLRIQEPGGQPYTITLKNPLV